MAIAVEHCGLHNRVALRIIMMVGTSQARLMLGFMFTTMFLSMWISNTATTAMMLPIGLYDSPDHQHNTLVAVDAVAMAISEPEPAADVESLHESEAVGICFAYQMFFPKMTFTFSIGQKLLLFDKILQDNLYLRRTSSTTTNTIFHSTRGLSPVSTNSQ